jgi:type IV secretion system protein VirD4
MLLGIALALPAGLLGRWWWQRTPFNISARLPWRLSASARVRWMQKVFLGWTVGLVGEPRFAMGTEEDSVGVVGPPGVNKTAGIGVSQVLIWGGPMVSVSQTPLIMRSTASRRRQLARRYGGRVLIYAPTESGRVEGLEPLYFSPASSKDPTEVGLRVESWMAASATAKGLQDEHHFRAGAAAILRGCLLACAHHRVQPGDFSLVRRWLAARDLSEPAGILQALDTAVGDQWSEELEGIQISPAEREREGFFSSALTTIAATANPNVLRSTSTSDLDPERFLLSRSTLYVVSPTEHQRAVAPLISMLIDTLVRAAYRLHREGRLPARFGISLDDLANVAPLPQLAQLASCPGRAGSAECG